MSGHAGFQVIANRPQPINGGMQVGGVDIPEKEAPGHVVVSGGEAALVSASGGEICRFASVKRPITKCLLQ